MKTAPALTVSRKSYTVGTLVEIQGCKGTKIPRSGCWFVRHIDGDVLVAGSMYEPTSAWIEVSADRVRDVIRTGSVA